MLGMWPRSVICTPDQETARLAFAHRKRLLRERTRLTNGMNGIVLRYGHSFVAHKLKEKHGSAGIASPHILPMFEALAEGKLPLHPGVSPYPLPPRVGKIVLGYTRRVEKLTAHIKEAGCGAIAAVAEAEFGCAGGELVKGDKLMKLLITIPGVSEMQAVVWLTQIVDATRFRNAQQVAAYCGFDPSLMVSAGKVTAHTRRRGHKLLHYSIKQAANLLIQKHSEPFGDWGWTMARVSKRGGWNRACGAVGRKMSVALWVCHLDQVAFNYDEYRFWRAPEVPDVDIVEVGLPTRQRNIFVENGIATTAPLTAAFYKGELADMEGVGPQCLVLIRRWINRFRDSSSTGR